MQVVECLQTRRALAESLEILLLGLQPLHFGQCCHARKNLIFNVLRRINVFCPDVGLNAENVLGFLGREVGSHGFEGIDRLRGRISADAEGLAVAFVGLIVVEIHRFVGGHNDVVTQFCGFRTRLGTAPRHNRRCVIDVAAQQLVPADESLALRVQELLDALREIALKMVFGALLALGLQSFLLNALLAELALFPAVARTLVAADVDVFRGEHVDDFGQHVFHEAERLLLTRAEHVGKHAPFVLHLVGAARAAELRIGRQCRHHVAGHVDFGNHRDVAFGCVAHDVATLLLRVETAVANAVVDGCVAAHNRACAPTANRGQLRVFFHFKAPALVVGEVPVELVHAVQGDEVDVFLHEVDGEEVARAVEVHAAIGKARLVLNHHCRQGHLCRSL